MIALMFTVTLSAKESDNFSKRELGMIQGCGIGVGLKFRTASKQQIRKMCEDCLNNVLHDEDFTHNATKDCVSVASNLKK